MKMSKRRRRQLLLTVSVMTVAVLAGVAIPTARDLLAFVVAFGLIALFVGIRLAATPLAHPSDRPWEFWGGMSTDEAQTKPPVELDVDGLPEPVLPDVDPNFQGHPLGESEADRR